MGANEVKEIKNKEVYEDLLRAGYVEEVKSGKKVKTNEN